MGNNRESPLHAGVGGITGWLLARMRGARTGAPRLTLLERISLGPRQSLALVQAEDRCFLVATSAEGAPAFYALDSGPGREASRSVLRPSRSAGRVSW